MSELVANQMLHSSKLNSPMKFLVMTMGMMQSKKYGCCKFACSLWQKQRLSVCSHLMSAWQAVCMKHDEV